MSVEVHVFYRGALPSKSALMQTLRALDLSMAFAPGSGPLEKHSGFLPMKWRGEETGFEFDVISDPSLLREHRVDGIDAALDRCAVLHLGGDMTDLLAAQSVAAALAKLTGGTVYDPEEGRVQTLDEAIAAARSTFEIIDKSRRKRPRGTRPADIRHYLKPLLRERPDLILRDRWLFIRHARHFVRGVRLNRYAEFEFDVGPFFKRLYLPSEMPGIYGNFERVQLWEGHAIPWLFDILQQEGFEIAGQLRGISDLARYQYRRENWYYSILDHLLAGERDQAELVVQYCEQRSSDSFAAEQRALFERNIEDLCVELHKQEAATVQALDLEEFWEPTPFPVELPAASRRQQTDETLVSTTPWPTIAKEPVTGKPPDTPGEIAFARNWSGRRGEIIMVAPITREEAEQRHDEGEEYCLFVRLPGDEVLVLHHWSSRDALDPMSKPKRKRNEYWLWVDKANARLLAQFHATYAEPGTIDLHNVRASRLESDAVKREEVDMYLNQGTWRPIGQWEKGLDNLPITDVERTLMRIPMPRFGEYEAMLARANELFEHGGGERFTK